MKQPPRPVKRKQNGHRWRQLVARVKAEETHCALCGKHVDLTLPHLDPRAPAVDHIIPVARGGPEYDRANLTLMCRACNRWKSTLTLDEARAKLTGLSAVKVKPIEASPGW